MATLWKRATPSQYVMLRMVAGAVICTQDHHNLPRNKAFARSVAKRAVGYLTSQQASIVTADSSPRQKGFRERLVSREPQSSKSAEELLKGDRLTFRRRSPLQRMWKEIASTMWRVKKESPEEFQARIKLLSLLDQTQRELEAYIERNNHD